MKTVPDHAPFIHDHMFLGTSHDENAKRTLWVVALTFTMMIGEIIAGHITGSMALLADGFHMATHAGALGIAAAAYAFAKRNASNNRFSFGTGKVGDLAGFASAGVLGMISIAIGVESVMRLFQPTTVAFEEATIIAIVGLGVNMASAFLLSGNHHHHGDDEHHHAHHGNDNNLRSAYVHVLADALTSILAIIALLAGRYLNWVWLDPVIGVVGAIVIARWAYVLMKAAANVLLDMTDEHLADEIREVVEASGDTKITDLHVWQVGPEARAAIVSVVAHSNVSVNAIRERLASIRELSHLTIEYRSNTAA